MNVATTQRLVVADVGNSRIKLGQFSPHQLTRSSVPQPEKLFDISVVDGGFERIADWLAPIVPAEATWYLASVNRPAATRMVDWLRQVDAQAITMLCAEDLPLVIQLPRPDMVGVDRLLAAVTALRLKTADRPAVMVDLGSAITVDLLSADGAFQGGAILPGIAMAARGMYEFTDLLPLLDMHELDDAPAPIGTSTEDAMRAGLFWGAIGGVRELIQRYESHLGAPAEVFLSGGAAPSVAGLLKHDARFEPHLVLSGIALTAAHLAATP